MALNPKYLTRAMQYRIDGLGDGVEYARWTYGGHAEGKVMFNGPGHDQTVLDLERIYEVRLGLLHYLND
jgi:hypothetical protein